MIDEGDCIKVVATVEDFESAKKLYESRAENLTSKMTDAELHFVRWLKTRAGESVYTFTVNDAAKAYKGPAGRGLSPKTIERMLLGRKDRNTYGLIDKVRDGGLTEEMRSETVDLGDGSLKRNRRFREFSFDPSGFDLLGTYSDVVKLKNPPQDPGRPEKTPTRPKLGSSPSDPLDSEKKKKEEENTQNTQGIQTPGGGVGKLPTGKDPVRTQVGSFGSFGSSQVTDSDSFGSSPGLSQGLPGSPPKEAGENGRVFGLSRSYYFDLGGGKLPSALAIAEDQGWPSEKAAMALGLLKKGAT